MNNVSKREIEDIETSKIDDNTLLVENVKIEIKNDANESSNPADSITKVNLSWNLEVFYWFVEIINSKIKLNILIGWRAW